MFELFVMNDTDKKLFPFSKRYRILCFHAWSEPAAPEDLCQSMKVILFFRAITVPANPFTAAMIQNTGEMKLAASAMIPAMSRKNTAEISMRFPASPVSRLSMSAGGAYQRSKNVTDL